MFPLPGRMNQLSFRPQRKLKQLFPSNTWKFMTELEIKPGLPNSVFPNAKAAETSHNSIIIRVTAHTIMVFPFSDRECAHICRSQKKRIGNSLPGNLHL